MRRIILTAAIMLTALSALATGKVRWLTSVYDFGTFSEAEGEVSCTMKFVNDGDAPIVITRVRPTCGCTATEFCKDAVAPGDTAEVMLTYNAVGRPGRFKKDAYVYTNAEPQKSCITIQGNVIGTASTLQAKYPIEVGGLRLDTRILPFGELVKGKSRTAFINGYNSSRDTLKLTFSDEPKNLRVAAVPSVVAPGEQVSVTVSNYTLKQEKWGLCQDQFTIMVKPVGDSTTTETTKKVIDVSSIVIEDFDKLSAEEKSEAPVIALSTDKLDFASLGTEPMSQTFEIENNGKSSLMIRQIGTLDDGVTVEYKAKEVKKGKRAVVRVTVDPQKVEGDYLNGKITILTNDPYNWRMAVRVVGVKENKQAEK